VAYVQILRDARSAREKARKIPNKYHVCVGKRCHEPVEGVGNAQAPCRWPWVPRGPTEVSGGVNTHNNMKGRHWAGSAPYQPPAAARVVRCERVRERPRRAGMGSVGSPSQRNVSPPVLPVRHRGATPPLGTPSAAHRTVTIAVVRHEVYCILGHTLPSCWRRIMGTSNQRVAAAAPAAGEGRDGGMLIKMLRGVQRRHTRAGTPARPTGR